MLINKLNNDYNPKNPKKAKENLQENCWMREKILLVFLEKGTFLYKGNIFKTKEEKSEEESEDESEEERVKKFFEYIDKESKDLNYNYYL